MVETHGARRSGENRNFRFMGRRVPRDPETSPRDAVKVTGWAIRRTILRNTSERHLRRSLITFEDEVGSPRDGDGDNRENRGDSDDASRRILAERVDGRNNEMSFPISESPPHDPDCLLRHEESSLFHHGNHPSTFPRLIRGPKFHVAFGILVASISFVFQIGRRGMIIH